MKKHLLKEKICLKEVIGKISALWLELNFLPF